MVTLIDKDIVRKIHELTLIEKSINYANLIINVTQLNRIQMSYGLNFDIRVNRNGYKVCSLLYIYLKASLPLGGGKTGTTAIKSNVRKRIFHWDSIEVVIVFGMSP